MENEKEPFPSENNLILSLSVNRIHEEELDSKKDIPSRPALEKIPSTMDVKQAENGKTTQWQIAGGLELEF